MFLLHELLVSRGFFYMKKWLNIDISLAFFFLIDNPHFSSKP